MYIKTKLFLLFGLFAACLLISCNDDEDPIDEAYKLANEAQFAKITADPAYTKITSQSANGHIMYKELVDGNTGERPYFSDTVSVRYTGWYKNDWNREDTYIDGDGNLVRNKVIFDSTADNNGVGNNIPRTFNVGNKLIDGFSTALQHMEVGDKWEVWIPWQLGYGAIGQREIKAYSTLVFEIELVDIVR